MTMDTSLDEPIFWRRPSRVTLQGEYLVAGGSETKYPLLSAAHEGYALRAFVDAATTDEVCQFTKNWGFLHARLEEGRWDRFPLKLFHFHRKHLLTLARLSSAVRSEVPGRKELAEALRALKASQEDLESFVYRRQPSRSLDKSLRESERALSDERRRVSLAEYAARALASELSGQQTLRPVKRSTRKGRHFWAFEEVPMAYSLEQVLRWTLRSQYRVLHYFLCESCGKGSMARRTDTRFCSPECGTRVRVQRLRKKRRLQNHAARESQRTGV
jgi:hypothetical protein